MKRKITSIKIEVNQDTVNYIQAISMECSSRQSLLNTISQLQGTASKAFKDYHKEYVEFDAEYQLIKERLQEIYIPKKLRDLPIDWSLDFQTNLLTVTPLTQEGIELINSYSFDITPNCEDDIIERFSEKEDEE